jgi:hypothetical protein
MNKELIKQLADGEIAVCNDGTKNEIRKVLSNAFPDCVPFHNLESNFYQKTFFTGAAIGVDETRLKTYSVKAFLKQDKAFPRIMLVSDCDDISEAHKRVVFAHKKGYFIAWRDSETMEDSENQIFPMYWKYAWELDELEEKESENEFLETLEYARDLIIQGGKYNVKSIAMFPIVNLIDKLKK